MDLNIITNLLPIIQQLLPLDSAVYVSDREKFLRYLPGKQINQGITEGMEIPKNTGTYKCLQLNQRLSSTVSKEAFGFPYKAIMVPLRDDANKQIGVLTVAMSLETQDTLINAVQMIVASSEQTVAATDELAATATDLSATIADIRNELDDVVRDIKKTNDILSFVNAVAANSNLLGLNAALEAARAGEYGRGFAVVADEIRKMAASSSESVKNIKAIVDSIQTQQRDIYKKTQNVSVLSERQAAASEEIAASMQQIASSAKQVEKISEIL